MKDLSIIKADLMVFDEAHHVVGNEIQNLVFGSGIIAGKTLFTTATPKDDNGIEMTGEDGDCGPLVYEYTHRQAVEDGICNDIEIVVSTSPSSTSDNLSTRSILKAIVRNALETRRNRVLAFHGLSEMEDLTGKRSNVVSFVKQAKKEIHKVLHDLVTTEFMDINPFQEVRVEGLTSSTKERDLVIKEFEECNDDCLFILSSCRIIGEGLDTKNANTLIFVDGKQSPTDIIQNIGRVTRFNERDPFSSILIPVAVNVSRYEEITDDSIQAKDRVLRESMGMEFQQILNVLGALKPVSYTHLTLPTIYSV